MVGDTSVLAFSPLLTQLSFQSHRLLFSHASAEVRGENTPERKFASMGYQTHNYSQVSPTCSPLNHPGEAHKVLSRNSVPNNKILALLKSKAFADDKFNVTKIMIYVFNMVKNIVGKGQNAGYQHFLFFPTIKETHKRKLLRIFWEKEEMLVTSIFSFSHNVSYTVKDTYHH